MTAPWLPLAAILAGVGIVLSTTLIWLVAWMLLCPPRMTDARALVRLRRLYPSDLGMEFEDQNFVVLDESTGKKISLAAWWIPSANPSARCAILLHGYADAKVGSIAWAPLLRGLGFNVLAIDLRAHGQSEGKYCTAGYYERQDVSQVIEQIRGERPEQTREMVLFGASLGAAVAAATAAGRDDLFAVVLESSFADYSHAIAHQADRIGLPGAFFQRLALWAAQRMARCDFSAVRPVDLIPQIKCPVMMICYRNDPFVPAADLESLRAAAGRGEQDTFWEIDGVHHLLGLANDPAEYSRRVAEFFEKTARIVPSPARL
jgi:pimeloyl-ACP methyl ester carboxylesterase